MGVVNILCDSLAKFVENDIKAVKSQNAEYAKAQIEYIKSNPYISDIAKEYMIYAVVRKLEQEQRFQSGREFLLGISQGLNEASKFAEQMANKQEQ